MEEKIDDLPNVCCVKGCGRIATEELYIREEPETLNYEVCEFHFEELKE